MHENGHVMLPLSFFLKPFKCRHLAEKVLQIVINMVRGIEWKANDWNDALFPRSFPKTMISHFALRSKASIG
ncbi:hypothetical protein Tco_0248187 [Tanacetum coccineum]